MKSRFLGFVASAYKEHDKRWARKVGADHNSLDLFLLDAVVNTKGDRSFRLGLLGCLHRQRELSVEISKDGTRRCQVMALAGRC